MMSSPLDDAPWLGDRPIQKNNLVSFLRGHDVHLIVPISSAYSEFNCTKVNN